MAGQIGRSDLSERPALDTSSKIKVLVPSYVDYVQVELVYMDTRVTGFWRRGFRSPAPRHPRFFRATSQSDAPQHNHTRQRRCSLTSALTLTHTTSHRVTCVAQATGLGQLKAGKNGCRVFDDGSGSRRWQHPRTPRRRLQVHRSPRSSDPDVRRMADWQQPDR